MYEWRRHLAKVSNNQDPEYRGRIKVICSGITGDEEAELPSWVEPALDWGFFLVPDVDEMVEVEMLMATPRDEVRGESGMLDPQLRWRGVRVWDSAETDQPRPVPDDFKVNYKRRGFATPAGHVLYFDDTDGATLVCLTWCDGADQPKKSSLLFDTDGTVKLSLEDGKHLLHFKGSDLELKLDEGATVKLEGKDAGAKLTLGDGAKHVAIVEALQALWGNLKTIFDAHTHPTGTGPSGPPASPAPAWDSGINSSKVSIPDG